MNDRLVSAIAAWNLVGLPVVLAVVAWRARGPVEPATVVRRLGLIHYGLALWSLTTVVSELSAYRVMGIFPANPIQGFAGSLIMIAADLPIGFGLRRLHRWARFAAIILTLFRLGLVGLLTSLTWPYSLNFDPTEWPRALISSALPAILLVVLLLPSTARAVRKTPGAPSSRFTATLVQLLLVVLGSVVVTDAVAWAVLAATGQA